MLHARPITHTHTHHVRSLTSPSPPSSHPPEVRTREPLSPPARPCTAIILYSQPQKSLCAQCDHAAYMILPRRSRFIFECPAEPKKPMYYHQFRVSLGSWPGKIPTQHTVQRLGFSNRKVMKGIGHLWKFDEGAKSRMWCLFVSVCCMICMCVRRVSFWHRPSTGR